MRKALVIILCVLLTVAFAQNIAELQKKHAAAMKANGMIVERDGQYMVSTTGASIYLGTEMGTGYMESGDKKIYWEVIPIEGGVKIVIKINIFGKIYEKTIIIKFDNTQASIALEGSNDRYDWMCILKCAGSAAFSCISCGTDWKCWATCAGPQVVQCVMGCF